MVNFNPLNKDYIVRQKSDLINTKSVFPFMINLITRANETLRKWRRLKFCVLCILLLSQETAISTSYLPRETLTHWNEVIQYCKVGNIKGPSGLTFHTGRRMWPGAVVATHHGIPACKDVPRVTGVHSKCFRYRRWLGQSNVGIGNQRWNAWT